QREEPLGEPLLRRGEFVRRLAEVPLLGGESASPGSGLGGSEPLVLQGIPERLLGTGNPVGPVGAGLCDVLCRVPGLALSVGDRPLGVGVPAGRIFLDPSTIPYGVGKRLLGVLDETSGIALGA